MLFQIPLIARAPACLTWVMIFGLLSSGCSKNNGSEVAQPGPAEATAKAVPDVVSEPVIALVQNALDGEALPTAPCLDNNPLVSPLADAYKRIDPTQDGWVTEAFNDAAGKQLGILTKVLEHASVAKSDELIDLVSDSIEFEALAPSELTVIVNKTGMRVSRAKPSENDEKSHGLKSFAEAVRVLGMQFGVNEHLHVKFKLYTIEPGVQSSRTLIDFQADSRGEREARQVNSLWDCTWSTVGGVPRLQSVSVRDYEEIVHTGPSGTMFADCTQSLLETTHGWQDYFRHGADYWRSRLPRSLGVDVVANHGLALGDANGDGLEDVYVCAEGGLPNRLLIRQSDGTLIDAPNAGGADWLEYCASALLVDLDNDGDRDLIVAHEWRLILMSNDGSGHFSVEAAVSSQSQLFSMAAADYDQDGDLDLYCCGYNPSESTFDRGPMGAPMPFHDANNGGRNMLLRNEGHFAFTDATAATGLEQNNTRFSFAVAWEDFDNDGDQDIYVANDYGRNNLYRNDNGVFLDVAAELGVEDISSGMSVAWGDVNRDGWMDLYVSNMFSSAGNRITYQRQFKPEVSDATRQAYQRMARGNSLFENQGGVAFQDRSESAAVSLGRWAWGSRFVDLNNDGWEDIVVANGFITTDDTSDL
ncbi:MAG: VCBS repeat-containing protein [Planctomycetia bacterium]|nr:VCBS repeat-containing protein [Planctomycetia bacterium]